MGFNSAFKGLNVSEFHPEQCSTCTHRLS